MKQSRFDYKSENLSNLGFGLMRLPTLENGEADMDHVKRMVDYFMENGMNYFDTAYVYHGGKSEVYFKEAVQDRYPREAYHLATKLPVWEIKEASDMEGLFNTHLERTGLSYIDFYLLHGLGDDREEMIEKMGCVDFVKGKKAEGKIRHIGFSFHGTAPSLRRYLEKYPELEFVQLQINYYDWDKEARELYEIAMEFNTPVIIMEPVRGGMLAKLPAAVEEPLRKAAPNASAASWAMRFCGSLDGVITILSGMSNLEQMQDNVATMKEFTPLTEGEKELVLQAAATLRNTPTVPCTACKYCVDCPQGIPIWDVFSHYNEYISQRNLGEFNNKYKKLEEGKRADACIDCGLCASLCPQSIAIPGHMAEIAGLIG